MLSNCDAPDECGPCDPGLNVLFPLTNATPVFGSALDSNFNSKTRDLAPHAMFERVRVSIDFETEKARRGTPS